ncbi:MAG: hypothetical protein GY856_50130 [bacterium]|nr:hypothetical protein [bacterium]
MRATFLVLERNLERDLEVIAELYDELPEALSDEARKEELIVVGFHLHGIYNAFENVFRNIARTFENTIDDPAGWHTQLLQRMCLDLRPIRPAVIDAAAYEKLDELRRFRHLFRTVYGIVLDPVRLSVALRKALELRDLYPGQIGAFITFLHEIDAEDSTPEESPGSAEVPPSAGADGRNRSPAHG